MTYDRRDAMISCQSSAKFTRRVDDREVMVVSFECDLYGETSMFKRLVHCMGDAGGRRSAWRRIHKVRVKAVVSLLSFPEPSLRALISQSMNPAVTHPEVPDWQEQTLSLGDWWTGTRWLMFSIYAQN